MHKARVVCSISEVDQARWDACAGGRLEGHDYLRAVEEAGLAGFDWRYVLVESGGSLVAAAPAFFTDYGLETTLTALGRKLVSLTRCLQERAFTLRLASLGSPCTEDVGLGFHPDVAVEERPALLRTLLEGFELAAAENGCWLLALKDAPAEHEQLWARLAGEARYQSSPGMPSAVLSIDFEDMPAYFARLSPGTRRDMRRKLRSLPGLRIERRHDISGLEQRVMELYRQTRSRSDLQFEELTDAYFTRVLARMGPRASCVLYWAEQELIGVNLLLQDKDTLLDKFFCMESVRGPAHNLYFLSWFTNVQYAIDNGLKRYQSGQAGYETKLRLGSTFAPAKTYFRHRRRLVNQALRLVAPLLSDDPVPQRGAA